MCKRLRPRAASAALAAVAVAAAVVVDYAADSCDDGDEDLLACSVQVCRIWSARLLLLASACSYFPYSSVNRSHRSAFVTDTVVAAAFLWMHCVAAVVVVVVAVEAGRLGRRRQLTAAEDRIAGRMV